MKKSHILYCLLVVTIVTSCNKSKDKSDYPVSQSNEFLSLTVGNRWEFEREILKITDRILINDTIYYVMTDTNKSDISLLKNYFIRIGNDRNIYIRDSIKGIDYLKFDFNKKVNESWFVKKDSFTNNSYIIVETYYCKLISTTDSVNINDSLTIYNCNTFLYYINELMDSEEFTVFAKGYGFVEYWEAKSGYGKIISIIINGKRVI